MVRTKLPYNALFLHFLLVSVGGGVVAAASVPLVAVDDFANIIVISA